MTDWCCWKDNTIQDTLIGLLGYESLDFVSQLLLNRDTIVHNIMSQVCWTIIEWKAFVSIITDPHFFFVQAEPVEHHTNNNMQQDVRRTAPGTGVTVQSIAEIQDMKRQRKEQKKAIRQSNRGDKDENEVSADILGFESGNWKAAREEALLNATQRPLFSSPYKVNCREYAEGRGSLCADDLRYYHIKDRRTTSLPQRIPVWQKWQHIICVRNALRPSSRHD